MIRLLVIFAIVFGANNTRAISETDTAQPPQVKAVVPLSDGDIVVGGKPEAVEYAEGPLFAEVPWVARRDRQGRILWEKTFGETVDFGFFLAAHVVAEGDIVTAGGGAGGGVIGPALIVRLDPQGNVRWHTTLPDLSSASAITPLVDGVIVAGSPRYVPATRSRWVARLDATGKVLWQKTFNEVRGSIYTMTSTGSGDVIVVGDSDRGCSCEGFQASEPWAARLNNQGDVLWQKDLGIGVRFIAPVFCMATSVTAISESEFSLKGKTFEFQSGSGETRERETGGWHIQMDGNGNVSTWDNFSK